MLAIESTDTLHNVWGTYFGGQTSEYMPCKIVTDGDGNVYLATTTSSLGLATTDAYMNARPSQIGNCIISKYSNSGAILWTTYFGGSQSNSVSDLAIDSEGNIVLVGNTTSTITMTTGAYQGTRPSSVATSGFIAKFSPAGGLLWDTYFGGSSRTQINSLVLDASNNIIIGGETQNGLYNITATGFDGFVAKFTPAGSYSWGTLVGGAGIEKIYGICVLSTGSIYGIGTTTNSTNFANNTFNGGNFDGFISKISDAGSVVWSKFIGGSGDDYGYIIKADSLNNLVAGLEIQSTNITPNGFQTVYGGGTTDCYLTKMDSTGTTVWNSYFGGAGQENLNSIKITTGNTVVITGKTTSASGIASNAEQPAMSGSADGYYAFVSPAGALIKSSYLGGTGDDQLYDVACSGNNYYFSGSTNSSDLIENGTAQASIAGSYDDFISVKSTSVSLQSLAINSISANNICANSNIVVNYNITGFPTSTQFKIQLSDASGSFADPKVLSTFNGVSGNNLTKTVKIPISTTPGTTYLLRILAVASNLKSPSSQPITVYQGNTNFTAKIYLDNLWNGTSQKKVPAIIEFRSGLTFNASKLTSYFATSIDSTGTISCDLSSVTPGNYYLVFMISGYLPLATNSSISIPNCDAANLNLDLTTATANVRSKSIVQRQYSNTQYTLKQGDLNIDYKIDATDQGVIKKAIGTGVTGIQF